MTREQKEKTQYITAIGFLITGIIICFISFFMNEYDIDNGSLWYLGQSVAFCAACFGLNLMVKNEVFDAEHRINERIDRRMKKVDDLLEDE
jgi:hypothetical protein